MLSQHGLMVLNMDIFSKSRKPEKRSHPQTEGKENTQQNTCPNLSKYLNYCCSMIVKKNI